MSDVTSSAEIYAKELLGKILVHATDLGRVSGKIVETEAYLQNDPASHSYKGKSVRNAPMFASAGTIYIYFTYGMHYCLNIATGPVGRGEAVLLRALEPMEGLDSMRTNRPHKADLELTNGPAKLVQALGITPELNGQRLGGKLKLEPGQPPQTIIATTRVGITQGTETKLRFYIAGNPYVSKK